MGTLQHTIYPKIQDKTVYEYALPTSGQYVSDLKLHCHPLIIDRSAPIGQPNYKLRLSINDIESVDYLSDNILLYQIQNFNKIEPINLDPINPDYSTDLDFFNDTKIITSALNPVTLRINFWREPVTPLWLTCTLNYIPLIDTSGVLDFSTHKYWNKMVWH
jgi:hypothetical protein